MANVVDLEEFKAVLNSLKGSTPDAVILVQVIDALHIMGDMLLDLQEDLSKTNNMIKTLESVIEHIPLEE